MARSKSTPLSAEEAQRAIYIDFEGREKEPPAYFVLCGGGDDQEFIQYVIDPGLWPAAMAKAEDRNWPWTCRPASWTDLAGVRARAESEDRRVIAYSEYDQGQLMEFMPDASDKLWFAANVVNALPLALDWKKKFHPDVVFAKDPKRWKSRKNRLELFFKVIEYEVPSIHGTGKSGQRIDYVRTMLATRSGNYNLVTDAAKRKWTNGLKHNYHDCNGLRELMLCAAEGKASC